MIEAAREILENLPEDAEPRRYADTLRELREKLAQRFWAGESVPELVSCQCEYTDFILRRLWARLMKGDNAALVAVGGYGRGELHPASDVDILILVAREDDAALNADIESLLMFLWDIGLEVGHAVRTPAECQTQAREDATVMTNLLESRLLCGDESLYAEMREQTGPTHIWPSREFFNAKLREQAQRHRRFDNSAYILEPNIKESPGGLRDIQTLLWVAERHYGIESLEQLVKKGFLREREYQTLFDAESLLWKLRFALHLLTGRHEDRLLFDHQRTLAEKLGYQADESNLAVEHMMQAYYRTVMEVSRLGEMLLQHFEEDILGDPTTLQVVPLNHSFQLRGDFIEARDNQLFIQNPHALLEIFLLLERHPEIKGVRASTIRLIREHRHLIDHRFRSSPHARQLFLDIMRQPRGVTHELRRMNRYGILAAYIPAFEHIVGRMQYDLFHQYTVDEHTLFLVRNLRRFAVPEFAEEFPLASQLIGKLEKPELLYLAGLFHDIGKGHGGDHSKIGAAITDDFCREHDFGDKDRELIVWLVRNHLVMSMTAQQKDIDDPEIIAEFATLVEQPVKLKMLYLLTVADSRATSPKRWNSWRDSLLKKLYFDTLAMLKSGARTARPDRDSLIQQDQQLALWKLAEEGFGEAEVLELWAKLSIDYFHISSVDEVVWQTSQILDTDDQPPLIRLRCNVERGSTELLIYSPDRKGLFAATTRILDILGLNIVDARIETADHGMTLNSFFILGDDGEPVRDPENVRHILDELESRLWRDDQKLPTITRRAPRQLKHFDVETRIEFEDDPNNQRTIMHLTSMDQPGLLAHVAETLLNQRIRLVKAKITTIGEEAQDTFLLTTPDGAPLDRKTRDTLGDALSAQLRATS